ncbi:uncharacterized protein LOC102707305 [Oryza brachyantha]|uniref:uncharacterized protein LOC102707305 n=1 Tax=Oryza brachyantha TaxID=4533 RepID=UPI001ADC8BEE|nr:uncharacterized protein LOC102707305 [Oryza brachyantha]
MACAGEYGASVRIMISYGGAIVQADGKAAYYAGGAHRIVKVGMSERLSDLRARMAALAGCSDVFVRYALPGEGLGRLRDVANDGDLWSLVSLQLYYHEVSKPGRVRLFLFGIDATPRTPAPPLRGASASSSSPALPALVEEGDTTPASGGACAAPLTHGMPRTASSPAMATSSGGTAVRMKVSYGGEMIQRDGSAASSYYAGGVHRIVRVGLSERLAELRPRLSALAGCPDVRIRYALPGEGFGGGLRDVSSDGDLWTLVSLLFFHEAVITSTPKQGRIRVFLFGGVDAPAAAAPLIRRGVSSPLLPTLVEEDGDGDTADDTTPTAGGDTVTTQGMRRSVSSPALMATSSSAGATSASAPVSSRDTPAMVQFAPVVFVPVMPAAMVVCPVIPVYAIRALGY